MGEPVGLQKQSREKEASQVGTRRSCTWRLGSNLWFLTNRRPLVALVGVVSGEWRSQKQDQGEPRRTWEARMEKAGLVTLKRESSLRETKALGALILKKRRTRRNLLFRIGNSYLK